MRVHDARFVLGIRDSRELELARKEFAEHPSHMTNRLLFARSSASPSIETSTGMNYSRRDIDMLTRHAALFRLSFAVTFDTSNMENIYRPLFAVDYKSIRDSLSYLSFRPFIVDFVLTEFT